MYRLVILSMSVVLVVVACSSNSVDTTTTTTTTTPVASPAEVGIDNFQFMPRTVQVKVGDTVTWVNHQGAAHTVVSVGDGPIASELMQPDDTYSVTFAESGTFSYQCTIHPSMLGEIQVSS